ncbi:response regulator [Devosia soli]|uniref:response regulator n=1 Tax=Devosia soli TaxID=361041 RepID=UPI00069A61C5|nr:response regulator [Devosia soli]
MLNGKRILLVEDDQHLADDLAQALRRLGAVVLGPAPTPYYAMHLLGRRGVDLAILDDLLHGIPVFGLADELVRRSVPVVFTATGAPVPQRFCGVPRLDKPYDEAVLIDVVSTLLTQKRSEPAPREFDPEPVRLDDGEVTSRIRLVRAMSASLRAAARRHAEKIDMGDQESLSSA